MPIHLDDTYTILPAPHSHQSQARILASNDDGNLVQSINLQGGCLSPLRSSLTILEDGTSATNYVAEYICKDVSDANYVLSPEGGNLREGMSNTYAMEEKTSMPRGRYRHSSSAINGMVWVLGGIGTSNYIVDEIDIYDVLMDTWTTFEENLSVIELPNITKDGVVMNQTTKYGVMDHSAFVRGQYIFLVGGFDQSLHSVAYTIAIDVVLSMEQKKLIYIVRSPMHVPRGAFGLTQIGDLAMVAGGFTSEDGYCEAIQSAEVYDPISDSWIVMHTPLKHGRARPNLIYSNEGENPVVYAIGGERRGVFDSATGICDGDKMGYPDKNMNTLEKNKSLPYRLTYPISSVEVMHIKEDIYLSTWRALQKNIKNYDNRIHYTVATLPSHSSLFFIGGVISHVTKDKLKTGNCVGCFVLSSHIMVHDTREPINEGLLWIEILSIVCACLAVIFAAVILFIARRRKRKKRNEDVREDDVMVLTESQLLTRGQLEWRGQSIVI
mmetsp:Transcript_28280/g.41949  ORF Transcript_28280/g.41949 Transcript_28280/m.41949 type:complete len:496 (-) Transcript_28280:64-1551(-)